MLHIIRKTPNENGSYPPIQTWNAKTPPDGYAIVPDTLDTSIFYEYNGFVILTIEDDTVTDIQPNTAAWEAWKESLPQEEPAEATPTAQEDTDALLVDLAYRVALLELENQ